MLSINCNVYFKIYFIIKNPTFTLSGKSFPKNMIYNFIFIGYENLFLKLKKTFKFSII